MENFVLIPILLAAGIGLRRVHAFPETTGQVLNMFVVYVSLPALVLVQVPKLAITPDLWVPVAMPWMLLALSAGAVLGLSRILGWSRPLTGGMLLVVPLGNTSFLGIPMVETFFTQTDVGYALLYDQLGTFLALAIYGAVILAAFGEGGAVTIPAILRRIATFPPFLALLAGLAFRQWPYPEILEPIFQRIGATLVPVVMVAVGFQLRFRLPREDLVPLGIGLALKLVATPLAAYGLVSAFDLWGDPSRIAVFEAGMPSMITAGALAMSAGMAPATMAAMVGMGIALSFASLPILAGLLGNLPPF